MIIARIIRNVLPERAPVRVLLPHVGALVKRHDVPHVGVKQVIERVRRGFHEAPSLTVVGRPEVGGPDGSWLCVRACGELDRTAVGIRAPSFLIGRTVRIELEVWLTPAVP